MDFQEFGGDRGDWMDRGQRQVEGICEYGKEPSGSIKCGKYLG
jgi:hypothetical protein